MNITLRQAIQLLKQYNKAKGTQAYLVLYDDKQCQLMFGHGKVAFFETVEEMIVYITKTV